MWLFKSYHKTIPIDYVKNVWSVSRKPVTPKQQIKTHPKSVITESYVCDNQSPVILHITLNKLKKIKQFSRPQQEQKDNLDESHQRTPGAWLIQAVGSSDA